MTALDHNADPGINLGTLIGSTDTPDKPLLIGYGFDGSETIFTLREVDQRADGFALLLLERGLVRGDRIGLLSANRPEYVVALLGAIRAGIVPVPMNYKFPRATLSHIVNDCAARLVLCDADRHEDAEAVAGVADVVDFDMPGLGDWHRWRPTAPFTAIAPTPEEVAMILYTSGSTGLPKGVMLSHGSHRWVAETRIAEYGLREERVLIAAPLYHMNALALLLLVCASASTAVLLPAFKAPHYIDAIERFRCTWLTAVPPMIAMMLREKTALAAHDMSSVKAVRMGSAPVTGQLLDDMAALMPGARIINAYGTTEGGPVVFVDHPDGRPTPVGAVGVPHRQVSVRLTGPDAPHRGELELRSPGMMLGYVNRARADSSITEDGYYRTGDVFSRDADNFHTFVGREDDMFVSGGENVFPGEVERVLTLHPDIVEACVVPVDDELKGTKPVAFVQLRTGADLSERAVKEHALEHAPAYLHPRRVWFMARLPLSTTNKVDRNALKQLARDAVNSDGEAVP
ncbi:hypothetical protein P775_16010 [Puniceibacterium antarcticum]|uniref:Acetyl-CoA synthetase n=1 Tax=Puniceibacterium antarcticum TaxID=1206336 RepID=A0A2G8RCM1_9RHOB|nr:class I adenylate-forming enzyme family protein [Puniceibacterium antarcticum]PIL19171.1 hypothetical protein P775_16010 [Puniceibacterium antarcticum]